MTRPIATKLCREGGTGLPYPPATPAVHGESVRVGWGGAGWEGDHDPAAKVCKLQLGKKFDSSFDAAWRGLSNVPASEKIGWGTPAIP